MVEEKKYERVRDPFKMFLEEALERQRDAMMDNFAQILQWLPTSDASSSTSHPRGATPFKERDQDVSEFTNTFHTLRTKLGIKDTERHLVLKYHGCLHKYIKDKMEFLDISKASKRSPQTTKQGTNPRWGYLGQPVEAASKEQHHEDEKGHGKMGLHVDPSKIQVIQDWPAPTTLTKLYNFLGLANFYRRFVLGFSHIAWPLSQVTKGRVKEEFFWSETEQRAFSKLKNYLYSAPVLTLPYLQQPFEIETDASDYAIGAILTQHGNPMAYHSETLSETV
eukprot:PITA_36455